MKSKVIVIYDDTRKPSREIASITGQKSFGDTIFKRKTLRERVSAIFGSFEYVEKTVCSSSSEILNLAGDVKVVLFFSDYGIIDEDEVKTLVYKACFAHENYKITHDGKVAMVIFDSVESFKSASKEDFAGYTEIIAEGLVDLSIVSNFRTFITSGFEARFFNSLSGDEYTLSKKSENITKLKAEYCYYELLPDEMKQWFVRPFGYSESGSCASYKMQRYHMTDLAIRYVHGAISDDEFSDILSKLFYFINIRQKQEVSAKEYEEEAKRLYIDKVHDRIEKLKSLKEYEVIASYIKSGTDYENIDEVFIKYKTLYEKIRTEIKFDFCKAISHGDMCFSNILYSRDVSLLLFIDPKGAQTKQELFMDPYYDLAKLSHSICGHYDYFNSDLYEIGINENLKTKINVFADNRSKVEIFKKFLSQNGIDFRLVRLYEASLFLSMLPLHMDRPKKVFAFILNAIAILESLEV